MNAPPVQRRSFVLTDPRKIAEFYSNRRSKHGDILIKETPDVTVLVARAEASDPKAMDYDRVEVPLSIIAEPDFSVPIPAYPIQLEVPEKIMRSIATIAGPSYIPTITIRNNDVTIQVKGSGNTLMEWNFQSQGEPLNKEFKFDASISHPFQLFSELHSSGTVIHMNPDNPVVMFRAKDEPIFRYYAAVLP